MEHMNEILISLRKENSLSQKELAERTGISQSTIAKIEIGRNEATSNTIRKLADFFNVTADYLLGRTDDFESFSAPLPKNTNREVELLLMFRKMTTAQQNRFLGIAEGMIEEATKLKKRKGDI